MTIDGRFFAVVAMLGAGSVLATVLVISGTANRFTLRDVIVLVICVLVGAIAALWLRRHPKGGPA